MSGVFAPYLRGTEQRGADEAPQMQIAAFIQPELRLIRIPVARISDLTQPCAVRCGRSVRDDGQSTLRASVHVRRHWVCRRTIDAYDPAAERVAALRDCDHAVAICRQPGSDSWPSASPTPTRQPVRARAQPNSEPAHAIWRAGTLNPLQASQSELLTWSLVAPPKRRPSHKIYVTGG